MDPFLPSLHFPSVNGLTMLLKHLFPRLTQIYSPTDQEQQTYLQKVREARASRQIQQISSDPSPQSAQQTTHTTDLVIVDDRCARKSALKPKRARSLVKGLEMWRNRVKSAGVRPLFPSRRKELGPRIGVSKDFNSPIKATTDRSPPDIETKISLKRRGTGSMLSPKMRRRHLPKFPIRHVGNII